MKITYYRSSLTSCQLTARDFDERWGYSCYNFWMKSIENVNEWYIKLKMKNRSRVLDSFFINFFFLNLRKSDLKMENLNFSPQNHVFNSFLGYHVHIAFKLSGIPAKITSMLITKFQWIWQSSLFSICKIPARIQLYSDDIEPKNRYKCPKKWT